MELQLVVLLLVRHNYIRGAANNSNHFESSANAMKTLVLSANDTISISQRRLAGIPTPPPINNQFIHFCNFK